MNKSAMIDKLYEGRKVTLQVSSDYIMGTVIEVMEDAVLIKSKAGDKPTEIVVALKAIEYIMLDYIPEA